jgi:hypothetical protein
LMEKWIRVFGEELRQFCSLWQLPRHQLPLISCDRRSPAFETRPIMFSFL